MVDLRFTRLVSSAPIVEIKSIGALQWIYQLVPLRHRWFPLLRLFLPERGLIALPFASGRVLYPAAWAGPFNASYLISLPRVFPERGLFETTLRAAAGDGAVVDVGANLGVYTLMTRGVSRARIIAYEPSPLAFHVFMRMLDANGLKDIDLRLKACGETRGRACLQEGINSYVGGTANTDQRDFDDFDHLCRQTRDGFTSTDAEQVTLDDELAGEGPIGLIKIDCEGYEHKILLGARRVLAEQRPTLFIELHPEMIRRVGDTPEGLCRLLHDSAYEVECWNFQRTRHAALLPRLLSRYGGSHGHRYRDVDDMLSDLPKSRPEQVYLVATPAIRQSGIVR
jgi:FkbM family methyltransferase